MYSKFSIDYSKLDKNTCYLRRKEKNCEALIKRICVSHWIYRREDIKFCMQSLILYTACLIYRRPNFYYHTLITYNFINILKLLDYEYQVSWWCQVLRNIEAFRVHYNPVIINKTCFHAAENLFSVIISQGVIYVTWNLKGSNKYQFGNFE